MLMKIYASMLIGYSCFLLVFFFAEDRMGVVTFQIMDKDEHFDFYCRFPFPFGVNLTDRNEECFVLLALDILI